MPVGAQADVDRQGQRLSVRQAGGRAEQVLDGVGDPGRVVEARRRSVLRVAGSPARRPGGPSGRPRCCRRRWRPRGCRASAAPWCDWGSSAVAAIFRAGAAAIAASMCSRRISLTRSERAGRGAASGRRWPGGPALVPDRLPAGGAAGQEVGVREVEPADVDDPDQHPLTVTMPSACHGNGARGSRSWGLGAPEQRTGFAERLPRLDVGDGILVNEVCHVGCRHLHCRGVQLPADPKGSVLDGLLDCPAPVGVEIPVELDEQAEKHVRGRFGVPLPAPTPPEPPRCVTSSSRSRRVPPPPWAGRPAGWLPWRAAPSGWVRRRQGAPRLQPRRVRRRPPMAPQGRGSVRPGSCSPRPLRTGRRPNAATSGG